MKSKIDNIKESNTAGFFKRRFKLREWFDYERVSASTNSLKEAINHYFVVKKKPLHSETFQQAMVRLGVDEQGVMNIEKRLKRMMILMVVIFLLFVCYTAFHLMYTEKPFTVFVLCCGVIILNLSLFFRYSFWRFQIIKRDLSVTLRDWVKFTLGYEKL